MVFLWQVTQECSKTFSHYQFSHLTVDVPKRNAQEIEFSISRFIFPCLYEMWRTEISYFVPSETDYIIHFVKTSCTDKSHPWSISESQHLYTMLNPVMIVCENPLSVRPSPYVSADLCSRGVIYRYITQAVGWKTDITLF